MMATGSAKIASCTGMVQGPNRYYTISYKKQGNNIDCIDYIDYFDSNGKTRYIHNRFYTISYKNIYYKNI